MFKAIRTLGSLLKGLNQPFILNRQAYGNFSSWVNNSGKSLVQCVSSQNTTLEQNSSKTLLQTKSNNLCLSRNVTKFSLKTGKKRSVSAVLTRFYRLNSGLWIHRRAGAHKRLHKRNCQDKYGLAQHVVCTRNQCMTLDLMITDHHKKKKYYIDDPYEPYQVRHNLDYVLPKRRV